MLRSLVIAAATAAFGILASEVVVAQTPDAVPPAKEGICDSLIGGTPGLYGLCVAYCEAQDLNEMFQDMKAGGNPGAKILANYNKKKQPGDPDMPCIVSSPAACPCFHINLCPGLPDFICELNVDSVGEVFAGQSCSLSDSCANSSNSASDVCSGPTATQAFTSAQVSASISGDGQTGTCLARVFTLNNGFEDNVTTGMVLDGETAQICIDEINVYDSTPPRTDLTDTSPIVNMCMLAN